MIKLKKICWLVNSLLFVPTFLWANQFDIKQPAVEQFIQSMQTKHQLPAHEVKATLSQAKVQPGILQAISKPKELLPWHQYKKIFLTEKRIEEGVRFWKLHEATLKEASLKYGVPAEIILAILGVETSYGNNIGSHKVLDALVTLAFHYPPRADFFLKELEEFFLLTHEEKWNPHKILGSYAGAMGKSQFISSSYRKFAVDFDQNGFRDLFNSQDAIGSIANYFAQHGWKAGEKIIIPAYAKTRKLEDEIAPLNNPKPQKTLAQLNHLGIHARAPIERADIQKLFAVLELKEEYGNSLWLGANNFYVITRYNHSSHYAMAVYQLSEALRAAYEKVV